MNDTNILRPRSSQLWLIALFSLALCACAGTAAVRPSAEIPVPLNSEPPPSETNYWWRASFQMPFDGSGEPRWAMDLLLADQVLAPLLHEHAASIRFWRFHRRAGLDATGHQFSLIFYADEPTSAAIFSAIQNSRVVAQLIQQGYLSRVLTACSGNRCDSALGATSDSSWDPRLQKTWPYFLMGASAHWLALIEEVGTGITAESDGAGDQLARYSRIQDEISVIWRTQGQHAYLHHLSALFGYEPLLIQKEIKF